LVSPNEALLATTWIAICSLDFRKLRVILKELYRSQNRQLPSFLFLLLRDEAVLREIA